MITDDYEFRAKIDSDLEAHRAARKILQVEEFASREQLKKAYRRAVLMYHPDRNPNDRDAHKRFLLVKCAYELLAQHRPCRMLLEQIKSWPGVPEDDKYKLDNAFGYFLWWRNKFFNCT